MVNVIGKRLKTLRKSQGKTQQQTADDLKINRSTLSNYESGRRRPSLDDLRTLADYYGVNLNYFGVKSTDEMAELLARACEIFKSNEISNEKKDALYLQLAQLYFDIKSQQKRNEQTNEQ